MPSSTINRKVAESANWLATQPGYQVDQYFGRNYVHYPLPKYDPDNPMQEFPDGFPKQIFDQYGTEYRDGINYFSSSDEEKRFTSSMLINNVVSAYPVDPIHFYNLVNSGWFQSFPPWSNQIRISPYYGKGYEIVLTDRYFYGSRSAFKIFQDYVGRAPTEYEQLSFGLQENLDETGDKAREKQFRPSSVTSENFSTSPAPKGAFKYRVFESDRPFSIQDLGEINLYHPRFSLTDFQEVFKKQGKYKESPTSVCFFASRVWYGSTGYLAFTKVIEKPSDFEVCHQEADPTSDVDSDLVDTDGGFVEIPNMGEVIDMVEFSNSLLVFSKSGTWAVSGTQEGGVFTPKGYSVSKVSSESLLEDTQVVERQDVLLFLTENGLRVVQQDQVSLTPKIVTFDNKKVLSYFTDLKASDMQKIKVTFDNKNEKIYIMLPPNDRDYTILIQDVKLQAWYKFTFQVPNGAKIIDTRMSSGYEKVSSEEIIRNNYVAVFYNNEVVVQTTESYQKTDRNEYEMIATYSDGVNPPVIARLSFINDNFQDWDTTLEGAFRREEEAFIVTSYSLLGDTSTSKTVKKMHTSMIKTEGEWEANEEGGLEATNQSGCFVQIGYNFPETNTHDIVSYARWTKPRQIYKLPKFLGAIEAGDKAYPGIGVVSSKFAPKGRGTSLMFRFQAEQGKQAKLLSWALEVDKEDIM